MKGNKMKKILATLLAVSMTAGIVNAQQVLSRNAVGYVKVDIETNKLTLARVDFEPMNASEWTIDSLFSDSLPVGSIIAFWDPVANSYVTAGRTRSGWSPATNVIRRGEAFFILSTENTNLFFMGEVPDSSPSTYTTVIENVVGMQALGYPYPAEQYWTNMNLAINAAAGDILAVWDYDSQSYTSFGRTRSGWGDATNIVFAPGEGFWFRTDALQTWTEVKPYTWP